MKPAAAYTKDVGQTKNADAILSAMLAHYLPRMYLKRFTHNERVWVYDWIKAVKRSGKLRSVGAITDFYILKDGSGRRDDTVETQFLAKLEGAASPLIDALVEGSQLSASEREALAAFFALLCVRTPFPLPMRTVT